MSALVESLKEDPKFARFKNAPWLKPQDIIIGGCGGIGSPLAYLLARQGHKLKLYDFDTYEDLNMGSQLIDPSMLGQNKATALAHKLRTETQNTNIEPLPVKFTKGSMAANIMIGAFDNMKARKDMLERWYEHVKTLERDPKQPYMFMEAGMEAEFAVIRTVVKHGQVSKWLDEYTEDDENTQPVCAFRATAHNSFMVGSLMVSILNNYITNRDSGIAIRMVPYKLHYDLISLTFKTSF